MLVHLPASRVPTTIFCNPSLCTKKNIYISVNRIHQYQLPKLITWKVSSLPQFSFSNFEVNYFFLGRTRSCLNFVKPSRRERNTRSVSEIAAPSSYWTLAASIGLNTNILETNLINLILVLGILFYYGKGVCASRISEWDNWFLQLHPNQEEVQNPDEFLVNECYARTGAFRVIDETSIPIDQFSGLSSIWLKPNRIA